MKQANLKQNTQRTMLRAKSFEIEDSEDRMKEARQARQRCAETGRKFQELYGRVVEVLEETMTLNPPERRRHSAPAELLFAAESNRDELHSSARDQSYHGTGPRVYVPVTDARITSL